VPAVSVHAPVAVLATPDAAVTPFTSSVTRLPASAVPLKVGVVSSVTLSLFDAPVSEVATRSGVLTVGAVVSTTISKASDVVLLPAASVATACTK